MALTPLTPDILPIMVGTAGHVDHGKSALVQLLTGCMMDRHPEARKRGLTIDLGFAPCRLPGNRLVGIIDVPGHEDFIRNMVAGACSIDILMLIIAADDGVMPQTREHLNIVRLLRKAMVMVVITKIDLVEPEMRELVEEEVTDFMAQNGFPDAPVILESNITAEGLDEVRSTLHEMIETVVREPDPHVFRMSVERTFSIKGYGTVTTGIPETGKIQVGDVVDYNPGNSQHAVRTIQSYKIDGESAPAHACAAINLRDLSPEEVHRGDVISTPGYYSATEGFLVHLINDHASFVLKRNTHVKFHSGTAVKNASIRILDKDELRPGEEAFAHIRPDAPMVVAAGDRFIVRTLAPVTTLGGGIVLTAQDYKIKRTSRFLKPRLEKAKTAAYAGDLSLAELLAGHDAIANTKEAIRLTQCEPKIAEARLKLLQERGDLVDLGGTDWLASERIDEIAEDLVKRLKRYHKANPYVWGMTPSHACEILGLNDTAFKALLRALSDKAPLGMRHSRLSLTEFEPELSAKQMQLREDILAKIIEAGINGPAVGGLKKEFGIAEKELRLLTRLLQEEGQTLRIGKNLLHLPIYENAKQTLIALFLDNEMVSLPQFREATGASRNMAVALLDHFDGQGLTKRVDGGRVPGDALK